MASNGGGVVIVGAGHAGGQVAISLRQERVEGPITLIGQEAHAPYQRPPLSKAYLMSKMEREKLLFRPIGLYDKLQIGVRTSTSVVAIDRSAKHVHLADGSSVAYEQLVLATGARARRLTCPVTAAMPIRYLRTIDDVDALRDVWASGAALAIVGGGYIGLELASAAVQFGLHVTLFEAAPSLLARAVGWETAVYFAELHRSRGVDVRLSTPVNAIEAGSSKDFAIVDTDGRRTEADIVVAGIGSEPNVDLAVDAGLDCANGVMVDDHGRTSDPSIYAVGDCTSHPNGIFNRRIRLESVHNAVEQARTAAANIAGRDLCYTQVPWFWSDQYDVKLQSAGLQHGHNRTEMVRRDNENTFAVFYFLGDRLLAVDAVNSPRDFADGMKRIADREGLLAWAE